MRVLREWLSLLRLRFEQSFRFIYSQYFAGLWEFTRTALETTGALFGLTGGFIRKHVAKSPETAKQSIDEYKISPPARKSSLKAQLRESNLAQFDRFVREFYIDARSPSSATGVTDLPEFLQDTLRDLKSPSSERALLETVEGLEIRLRAAVGELSRERDPVDADILQEKTISYKRINQAKLSESKESHAVKKTIDKLHYDPVEQLRQARQSLGKLQIESGDEPERSICSTRMNQNQFQQGERVQAEADQGGTARALLPFGSGEMAVNHKSVVENPFKGLIKKRNLVMYSQHFENMKESKESVGLSMSKPGGRVESQLYSETKESPQLIVQKKLHRKRMIDAPGDKGSSVQLRAGTEISLDLRNTIESKDMGSLENIPRNKVSAFVFTSNLTGRDRSPELSRLENQSVEKFRTGQHTGKKSTGLYKQKKGSKKSGLKHVKKRKSSALEQIIRGHQKFSSVNLEYLMLKNTGRLSTFQGSQMSNIAEEGARANAKAKGSRRQRPENHVSNLMRMKSLVAKNSTQNYSQLMSSYLAKAKAQRTKKPKKRSRAEPTRGGPAEHFKTGGATLKPTRTKKKASTSKLFDRRSTVNMRTSRGPKKILKERSVRAIPGLRTVQKRRGNNARETSKKGRQQLRSIQAVQRRENKRLFANKKTTQSQLEPVKARRGGLVKKMKNLSYFLGQKGAEKTTKNLSKNYKKGFRLKIKKKDADGARKRDKESTKKSGSIAKNLKPKLLGHSGELGNGRGGVYKAYCSQLGGRESRQLKKQKRPRERKKAQTEAKKSQFI